MPAARRTSSLEQVSADVALVVLPHHLPHRHLQILLRNVHPPLPQRKHPRLRAHRLHLRAARAAHLLRDLCEVDPADEVHLARVDLEDVQPRRLVRVRELDLAVDPSRAQQRGVQDVDAVGGHEDLDVGDGLEAVELVQELEHGPLDLGVTAAAAAAAAAHPRAPDRVDLVHEDDRRRVLPRHHEQLPHHPRPLPDVLLHELRPADSDKGALGVVRDRAREERLSGARRAVEEDALGLGDAEAFEELGVLDGELDDLLDLLDLLVEAADHFVGGVRDLFDAHEGDEGVDLGGEDAVEGVGVVAEGHAGRGGDGVDVDGFVDVDDVFALGVDLDENLLLGHHLDDLADVGAGLVEKDQLLSKVSDSRVELVALRLEAAEVLLLLAGERLELVDLGGVVGLEPRVDGAGGGAGRFDLHG
mmetsp:Transcript_13197/g.33484  ORF Transcript_13197/g.33484 Transcript_13197/m.33484 type:complete len:417 (-) Transcript_13197:74-1324(-)